MEIHERASINLPLPWRSIRSMRTHLENSCYVFIKKILEEPFIKKEMDVCASLDPIDENY